MGGADNPPGTSEKSVVANKDPIDPLAKIKEDLGALYYYLNDEDFNCDYVTSIEHGLQEIERVIHLLKEKHKNILKERKKAEDNEWMDKYFKKKFGI